MSTTHERVISMVDADVVDRWLTESRSSGCSVSRGRRTELSALSANINRELASTDSGIGDARTLLADLKMQRCALVTVLDLVNNLHAPVRRLPVEILTMIFYLCVSSGRSRDKAGIFDAVRIASVCASWRKTALADTRLWTDIHVEYMWDSVAADIREREMVQTFLLRSGTNPLSLSVTGGISAVLHEPVTLTVLRNVAPRCKTLLLLDVDETHYDSLMSVGDGFRPTSLHIGNRLMENALDLDTISFKSSVERLRVTLVGGQYDSEWKTVHCLDIGDLGTKSTLSERLPSCTSLRSLTVRFGDSTITYPALVNNSLRLLEVILSNPTSCDPTKLFRNAMLPKLQHLVIQGDWTSWDACCHHGWNDAVRMLTSRCAITSLSLNGVYGTDCCLVKLLEALPLLQSLVFIALRPERTVVTQNFKAVFHRLTFRNFGDRAMGNPLCRYLTNLQVELNNGYFDEGALADMIMSRSRLLPYQQLWEWNKLRHVVVAVNGGYSDVGPLHELGHLRNTEDFTLLVIAPNHHSTQSTLISAIKYQD
ncbi:hypothetical protein K435DRAFT_793344 [Dendrothele bispora CBS 962.96]|uniref:F-box domain-containing protein n=1 Tax=Dendrothele bispora (strain CBS 962.96) TaxID=1314807 RepID=A0A4S8MGQ8_DENBC|nr:hypothetical protein K435DRAFT_793344 [Dendrothele bispora CBS 962.96]